MLNVFAERMEDSGAPKDAIAAVKLFAKDATARRSEHRDWSSEEERRCERQRTLFALLPDCHATDRLKEAMLQRAYDLLWDGDALGCDALIEFLPSVDVERLLGNWSSDFEGEEPKSKYYGSRAP